jgi:excisionase family DNA binding protein
VAPDNLLSTSQAAHVLGVSEARIRQMANDGTLECQTTPLGRLFSMEAVKALKESRAAT